jgi:integrase
MSAKITFAEAASDLLNDYAMNGKKTRDDAERRIKKHLEPFFGNRLLITITTSDLRAYIATRQQEGTPVRPKRGKAAEMPADPEVKRPVSAGEINRELTVLKRMFSLAVQAGRLAHKPHFPLLRENNVRTGFFEHEQYLAVLPHLPEAMRPVVTFAYVTGWRINSETLPLQWRQVDLKAGEVRLDPGTTKNMEGRVFYLTGELKKLLTDQRKVASRVQRQKNMIVQH